jgi:hypothetical protein
MPATLHAPLAAIDWAPKARSVAIVSRFVVALQVLKTGESDSGAGRFMTFVRIVSRHTVAENVADDGGMVRSRDISKGNGFCGIIAVHVRGSIEGGNRSGSIAVVELGSRVAVSLAPLDFLVFN